MDLLPLNPAPYVTRGSVTFTCSAAAHTADGTRAMVLVENGIRRAAEAFLISSGDERAAQGRRFAASAGASESDSVSALLDLVRPIEEGLQRAPTGIEWHEPVPLLAVPSLPPFPVDIFPDWIADHVGSVADFTQSAPDLAGMLALAELAAAAQRLAVVEPVADYREPLCLYILGAADSGERKSAIYKAMTQPLYDHEAALRERLAPTLARAQAERKILEQSYQRAMTDAAGRDATAADKERALSLAEELATAPPPLEPVLVIQDSTPEMLIKDLSEQGGCLAAFDAEGGLLDTLAGRYNENGPNLDPLLKAHACDEIRSARISRGRVSIKQPMLTMGIAPQPDVLVSLGEKAGARHRGLLARFLYALPPSLKGRRHVQRGGMGADARAAYAAGMGAMLGAAEREDGSTQPERAILSFTREAADAWIAFYDWVEPQLVPDGPLGGTHGWAEKLPGAVGRVAGLLHLAAGDSGAQRTAAVRSDVVRRAVRFGQQYLIPHAVAALRLMGADPALTDARKVLAWIERNRKESFSERDVYADLRRHFDRPEHVHAPLALLSAHHVVAELAADRSGPGRKASPRYATNPSILHPSQNT